MIVSQRKSITLQMMIIMLLAGQKLFNSFRRYTHTHMHIKNNDFIEHIKSVICHYYTLPEIKSKKQLIIET